MKRFFLVFMLLSLLSSLVCGCSTEGQPDQASSGGMAEAPDAPAANSLWGKQLRFEKVPIPGDAFRNEESRPIAMAPDGRQLLFAGAEQAPYLYNLETGEIRLISAAEGDTCAQLSTGRQQALSDYQAAHSGQEADLNAAVMALVSGDLRLAELYTAPWGNRLLLTAGSYRGVLDCDRAIFRIPPQENAFRWSCTGIVGDQMICCCDIGNPGKVMLCDIESGEISWLDYSFAFGPDETVSPVECAVGFPDGSVCAMVTLKREDGLISAAAILGPDGSQTCLPVGFGLRGSILVSPDSENVVVYPYMTLCGLFLLQRQSGNVSLLYNTTSSTGGSGIGSIPREDCEGEDEVYPLPEELGGLAGCTGLFPLASLGDGKTILMFSTNADGLLLYCPATGETERLPDPDEDRGFRFPTGNGYDLWFDRYVSEDSYYRLNGT